ncbi:MAG: HDIG domain-containing protein [Candidatus Bathyarchaeota archaeon]|nr:HDIG domain-containing protein [Candidatus Bathyarchaeota archaeon]
MSSGLPNREQALELLRKNHCPQKVVSHCIAVADLAVETAGKLQGNGLKINIELVEAGSLLHDLGRSKSHTVDHAVIGAQIAQSIGLPEAVINIIKRHVGGGITAEEAAKFGWPKDIYTPQTLEEKVVSYADKLIDQSKRIPIETEIQRLQKENKCDAAERVRRLHEEITSLLGNKP